MTRPRARTTALAVVPLLVLLGACGAPELSTDDLERQVATQLQRQVGRAPADVACEDALPAEVGATVRCVVTAGNGARFSAEVEAASVEGDQVQLDITVEDQLAG